MLNGFAIAYRNMEALGLKPGVFDGEDKQAELEVKRGEAIKSELPCLRRHRNVSATSGALALSRPLSTASARSALTLTLNLQL